MKSTTKEEPTAIIEARKKLEKERQIQENNLKMLIEYEYDLDIARQENLKKLEEEKKKEEELKREKMKNEREKIKNKLIQEKKKKEKEKK